MTSGVEELRIQSGYFGLGGLGPLAQLIGSLSAVDRPIRLVLGSNAGETLEQHVAALVGLMAMPRTNAGLAVVSYGNALYHPKTCHLVRTDGSQAAYVGSANLGRSGVSGLNVEAGLLLDERDGDPRDVIEEVGAAVDAWFVAAAPGVRLLKGQPDVAALAAAGVLAKVRPPRVANPGQAGGTGGGATAAANLAPLVQLPHVPAGAAVTGSGAAAPAPAPGIGQSVVRAGYPPNMRFRQGANVPTVGAAALSGIALPGGAVGLVLRMSKDTARHWTGGDGTANISLPLAAIEPLRFGLYNGSRPRAELPLQSRLVANGVVERVGDAPTSVMAYGYGPNPTGHKDMRMVLPKSSAQALAAAAAGRGVAAPAPGDYATLEWPTAAAPALRLTVMDMTSTLYGNVLALVSSAIQAGSLVGNSSCWLPAGISPPW